VSIALGEASALGTTSARERETRVVLETRVGLLAETRRGAAKRELAADSARRDMLVSAMKVEEDDSRRSEICEGRRVTFAFWNKVYS
tara:strand:+ start:1049 stop:1309 length:261 start_codon:yes stop_codon:yes gene_type:complete